MTIWHHRLTWHFFISAVYHTIQSTCHAHPIMLVSTILVFWTPNFKATVISSFVVHLLWKFTKWLETCWKIVVFSFVGFSPAVLKLCPTKGCATFLDHPIYFSFYHEYDCPMSCAVILHWGFVRALEILILLNFVVADVVYEVITSSSKINLAVYREKK